MAPFVSHVRAFRRTEHFRRLWKYASVSIVSTLVTQVVLFLTYHIWNVGSAVECNVIATVVASIPAYYLNRAWTWGKRGRSRLWGEVVPFWTIALVAMVLSTAAVGLAAHNADRIASGSLARALNCQRSQSVHLRGVVDGSLLRAQPVALRYGERRRQPRSERGRPERAAGERASGERGHARRHRRGPGITSSSWPPAGS